jgi:hypothetical protein
LLWYLSFAEDKPVGFLGAVIVQAASMQEARAVATTAGLNPGGEVAGWPVPVWAKVPPRLLNRLLSRETVEREFGGKCSDEQKAELLRHAQKICSHCNLPGRHVH